MINKYLRIEKIYPRHKMRSLFILNSRRNKFNYNNCDPIKILMRRRAAELYMNSLASNIDLPIPGVNVAVAAF